MSKETEPITPQESPRYGVIMPYSSNIDQNGNPYPSVFSFEAVRAAHSLYLTREIDKFVLCGEKTFGNDKKSTSDLMSEMLIAMGVPNEDIFVTPGDKLNNTALQLKAIARERKRGNLGTKPLTFVTWGFHEKRVQNHMEGFGVPGETVTVNSILERLTAHTQSSLAEMESPYLPDERKLRIISRFDKRGVVPRILTPIKGPRVMDIHGTVFLNTNAKKRKAAVVTV